ncbi:ferredoxin--NADP reductase [Mucilaginibacter sp. RS28]|uniref:Ferredoxin--NADP reductase n=1 Tax=Mucilaginibacter straminoryzae TaxID=2932774 RepID=A0A9X2B7D0_9SPHI|nr:ferredoxin--NADP reductase [Mucilaginibacter straminoryzae]MCJ8208186.1 ferredoxin--NADP reductase [Mucilaginibacter straminoryzae]
MEQLQLIVSHIKKETHDTATFYFKQVNGERVSYQAGQFITLIFSHHHEEVRRSYSLSSSPDEELLSITVKRVANGEISRYMLGYVKPGDIINATVPAGRFVLPLTDRSGNIVYFAAGSGIVPIYSHVKFGLKYMPSVRFTLIYSSQSEKDVIFREQLNALQSQYPGRLKVYYHISDAGDRLNNQLLEKQVKQLTKGDFGDHWFYICGPFTYMRMVQLTLLYMGVSQERIRRENFVLETVPVITSLHNFPPKKIRIYFKGEWHDVLEGENQTILQTGLQNNLSLPYNCRGGVCATCVARCTNGKVEMVKNETLTPEELAKGFVLTCTAHALEDGTEIRFE